jgi:hypothetical protein
MCSRSPGHATRSCWLARAPARGGREIPARLSTLDSASGVADPIQFKKQEVVAILERAGLSTVADDANRSLPDPVDFEHVAEFAAEHGITKDWLISRMGGSP